MITVLQEKTVDLCNSSSLLNRGTDRFFFFRFRIFKKIRSLGVSSIKISRFSAFSTEKRYFQSRFLNIVRSVVSTRFFLQKVYAGKNLKKEKKGAILFEANRLTDLPSEDAKRRGGSFGRIRREDRSGIAQGMMRS